MPIANTLKIGFNQTIASCQILELMSNYSTDYVFSYSLTAKHQKRPRWAISIIFVVSVALAVWIHWSMAMIFISTSGGIWFYRRWRQRHYFLGITHDLQVEMHSFIDFLPRSAIFDIQRIKYIRSPNPTHSSGLVFLDIDRQHLGVFNTSRITDTEFQQFLSTLREHNKILKFLNW